MHSILLHLVAKYISQILMSFNVPKKCFVTFLFACFSIVCKAEIYYYANYELHLYFKLDTETKEAQLGTGADFTMANAIYHPPVDDPWWDTHENLWEELVIPSTITWGGDVYTVTSVAPYAFYRNTDVRKITLPETIRTIGWGAFCWTVNLESINIPESVASIESSTFELCRNLERIHLPPGIRSIGNSAFRDCYKLKEINIPPSCISIGNEAFTWCESLSKVIIENGSETLDIGYCFEHKLGYTDGGVGKECETYWRGMFSDCPLDTLYLGRNINYPELGKSPFGTFTRLGYDEKGEMIYLQTGQSFCLEFGEGLTEIAERLFYKTTIENQVFFPNSLKIIAQSAFENTSWEQEEIIFPKSLDSIGPNGLNGFRFVECKSSIPPKLSNAFVGLVTVPTGSGNVYRSDKYWKNSAIIDSLDEMLTINVKTSGSLYSRILAQNVQVNECYRLKLKGTLNDDDWNVIGEMSRLYDLDLSDLTVEYLPKTVNVRFLRTINLPKTLESICDGLFNNCSHLSGIINIPSNCSYIGEYAFYNTYIEGVSYTNKIRIAPYAFGQCMNLKDVKIIGDGTIVGENAFNSAYIESLLIGKGVEIENQAFAFCKKLKNVTLEDSVRSIGHNSFYYCENLQNLYFRGIIEYIGNNTWGHLSEVHTSNLSTWCRIPFLNLKSNPLYNADHFYVNGCELADVVIPKDVERIRDYTFYGRKKIQNVKLHENIVSIGSQAFEGCSNLKSINMPLALKDIGKYSFKDCSSLTELQFPLNLSSIGEYAFKNCISLKKIVVHWDEPINVLPYTFLGCYEDCILYIPIATATKYLNAGWDFQNLKETGIMNIITNVGGEVTYKDVSIREDITELLFSPYQSFDLFITPDEGFVVKKIKIGDKNITNQFVNGKLYIEEPDANFTISVVFANNGIVDGDVNGDGIVDNVDVKCIMNYIVKKSNSIFYDYATDVNDDDVENITDAILINNKLKNENSNE